MLFVSSNIVFAIFFLILNQKIISYLFNKKPLNIDISLENITDLLPAVAIILSSLLVSSLTWSGLVSGAILMGYVLYYTGHRVTIVLPQKTITLSYTVKYYIREFQKWSVDYFSNLNILTPLWSVIRQEGRNFVIMLQRSKHDILVGLFIINPTKVDLEEEMDEIYNFQKKFFKYKKPVHPKDMDKNLTDEERERMKLGAKLNSDPKVRLNRLSRLPLIFDYSVYFNELGRFTIQNTIVFYNFFKSTLVAIILAILYFIYTIFFFKVQFLKQLSVWFVIGMMYFWLMSGFNFFLKRYQFGKFTSAIQRFWKRTNTYFWLIEGFLILIFFYYYLNSSQEPVYMYDYSALNQEYLISLHVAGTNIILLSLIIYFMYFTMLRINSNSWAQLNLYLIIISVFIFFSFFIETYQFYYVISTFNERFWSFNEEENLWSVEIDNPILRTKHQYLLMCLIAKYWHFLFIFLSWVFFLIKSFERRKVTYVLFGANLQNMIILYLLNFACYIQWFKWLYRRFADLPYTWFMTSIDTKLIFRLFLEIKLLLLNFFNTNLYLHNFSINVYKSLSLWTVDSLAIWKFI